MLHGNKVCRAAPHVYHLFADDCLLFCKATMAECSKLKEVMDSYELVWGQAINYAKSGIFFSQNVGEATRMIVYNILGVYNPLNTGEY